jgi:hypothetical protein
MFMPIQPLFSHREKNLSIFYDCRRSVGMKHIQAKNQHLRRVPFSCHSIFAGSLRF